MTAATVNVPAMDSLDGSVADDVSVLSSGGARFWNPGDRCSYATFRPGEVLVGRTVANSQFLRAALSTFSFEQLVLFSRKRRPGTVEQLVNELASTRRNACVRDIFWNCPGVFRARDRRPPPQSPADKLFDLLCCEIATPSGPCR